MFLLRKEEGGTELDAFDAYRFLHTAIIQAPVTSILILGSLWGGLAFLEYPVQLVDGLMTMQKFVKIAVIEPKIAKVPFTLDVSKFDIIMASLKWCQRKPIVTFQSLS